VKVCFLREDSAEETKRLSKSEESSLHELQADPFTNVVPSRSHSSNYATEGGRGPSLCIAVIGATGELARAKIFPALFALYYSGFLPEVRFTLMSMLYVSFVYILFVLLYLLNPVCGYASIIKGKAEIHELTNLAFTAVCTCIFSQFDWFCGCRMLSSSVIQERI
jgi:hypothetical protein